MGLYLIPILHRCCRIAGTLRFAPLEGEILFRLWPRTQVAAAPRSAPADIAGVSARLYERMPSTPQQKGPAHMDRRGRPLASLRVGSPKLWGVGRKQALRWRQGTEPCGGATHSLERASCCPLGRLAQCRDSALTTAQAPTPSPTTSRSGWSGSRRSRACRGRRLPDASGPTDTPYGAGRRPGPCSPAYRLRRRAGEATRKEARYETKIHSPHGNTPGGYFMFEHDGAGARPQRLRR